MEHLLNFTITKVYEPQKEGKPIEGEGEYGAWKLYTFYTDKTDKEKFSFMWGEKKPRPTKGLKIKHMEYEEEKKGQYTNLNVKKLELPEQEKSSSPESSPKTTSQPKPNNTSASFYVSYAKDIAVALITLGKDLTELDAIALHATKVGLRMMNTVNEDNTQNTPSEQPEGSKAASKTPAPDLTPENEKLSKQLQTYALADKKRYFEILGQHGATRASEIYEFAPTAQRSLLADLEKELGNIPF